MIPRDEPLFLESVASRLFAVWQATDGPASAGVLFCHPLGEEKKCAHRALVVTACALAEHGVASLRFDMSGCGDSEGEFVEAGFETWLADLRTAWSELRRRVGDRPMAVVGLRLGASLAALACEGIGNPAALVLWQPVVDGRAEVADQLRRLLVQQMITEGKAGLRREEMIASFEKGEGSVELDGYTITAALYRDICSIDLAGKPKQLPAACGVVQFTRPQRRIEGFTRARNIAGVVVDVPPIWIRSDFMPTRETGELLAREGVLRWLAVG